MVKTEKAPLPAAGRKRWGSMRLTFVGDVNAVMRDPKTGAASDGGMGAQRKP